MNDISDHPLTALLLDKFAPISDRQRKLKKGEPLKLTTPEAVMWYGGLACVRLIAHVGKLDHSAFYLRKKGVSGKYKRKDWVYIDYTDWIDYHLACFYTLHRSVYDCMLWFVNNTLDFKCEAGLGFEKKLLKKLEKFPKVLEALSELREDCEKFRDHRNDFIHRGAYVQAAPIMGNAD